MHANARKNYATVEIHPTVVNVPVEVGLHVCGTKNRRYVSRFQASRGKREAGGERETHATGNGAQKIITRRARLVLYACFALAFARLKNAKRKQLLFCKLQEQRNKLKWCTFFAKK